MKKLLIALVCVVFLAGCGSKPTTTTTTKEPLKPKFYFFSAEITENNIEKALSAEDTVDPGWKDRDFPDSVTNITITDSKKGEKFKNITIHFKPDTIWDETDLVKKVGGTSIIVGSILLKNTKVAKLELVAEGDMTDQYGKTKTEPIVKIVLSRETADKVDWEGLAGRHVSDQGNIYRIADKYEIHPGVYKNVKTEEVKLK